MAYSDANMSRIGHANGNNIWLYKTADVIGTSAGQIASSGYFNAKTKELFQFDVIIAIGNTGSTPTVDVLVVSSATGATTVTTVNGT